MLCANRDQEGILLDRVALEARKLWDGEGQGEAECTGARGEGRLARTRK